MTVEIGEAIAFGLAFGLSIGLAESVGRRVFGGRRLSLDDVIPGRMVRIGPARWQVLGAAIQADRGVRKELEIRLVNYDDVGLWVFKNDREVGDG